MKRVLPARSSGAFIWPEAAICAHCFCRSVALPALLEPVAETRLHLAIVFDALAIDRVHGVGAEAAHDARNSGNRAERHKRQQPGGDADAQAGARVHPGAGQATAVQAEGQAGAGKQPERADK